MSKAGSGHPGLVDICYVRQKEQNGWGDAIAYVEKHVGDEPFAVLLGDLITKGLRPCTKQLIGVYKIRKVSNFA